MAYKIYKCWEYNVYYINVHYIRVTSKRTVLHHIFSTNLTVKKHLSMQFTSVFYLGNIIYLHSILLYTFIVLFTMPESEMDKI